MTDEQKRRKAQKERERRERLKADQQVKVIDHSPETAMQASPPEFASPLDMQWKSPNGDPFDNMYKRQRKA